MALCAWQSLPGLVNAWRHSPFDRLGWLAFLLWLAPWMAALHAPNRDAPMLRRMSWAALPTLVAAALGDLNVLRHMALVLALAASFRPRRLAWTWLVLGVCWMPALGWMGAQLKAPGVIILRLSLGLAAAWAGCRNQCWKKGTT